MAKDEFGLLLELNRVFVRGIGDKIIETLLKMRDKSYLLSGDDSGLKNIWEEICIQQQTEHSLYWNVYDDLLETLIQAELESQPEAIQKLISYIALLEDSLNKDGIICISPEAAIDEIKKQVLTRAADFSNKNIERFLEDR